MQPILKMMSLSSYRKSLMRLAFLIPVVAIALDEDRCTPSAFVYAADARANLFSRLHDKYDFP